MADTRDPTYPDFVTEGTLVYVEIEGEFCKYHICVDSNEEAIVYDGVNFTVTHDSSGASAFVGEIIRVLYNENPYVFVQEEPITATPPVSVPVWIGYY